MSDEETNEDINPSNEVVFDTPPLSIDESKLAHPSALSGVDPSLLRPEHASMFRNAATLYKESAKKYMQAFLYLEETSRELAEHSIIVANVIDDIFNQDTSGG